jgi:hypothetical protein
MAYDSHQRAAELHEQAAHAHRAAAAHHGKQEHQTRPRALETGDGTFREGTSTVAGSRQTIPLLCYQARQEEGLSLPRVIKAQLNAMTL